MKGHIRGAITWPLGYCFRNGRSPNRQWQIAESGGGAIRPVKRHATILSSVRASAYLRSLPTCAPQTSKACSRSARNSCL